uniref:Uncharacterized protein n=1 Tax=Megaselia scalaris TaxID=36166 RepID=T1H5G5_MEGSC
LFSPSNSYLHKKTLIAVLNSTKFKGRQIKTSNSPSTIMKITRFVIKVVKIDRNFYSNANTNPIKPSDDDRNPETIHEIVLCQNSMMIRPPNSTSPSRKN